MKILNFVILLLLVVVTSRAQSPADWVNPVIGSSNYGTTNPGAVVPNGMVSVTPFNVTGSPLNKFDKDAQWWSTPFSSDNRFCTGFTHVNLSGVGCPDLGVVLLMPTTGKVEAGVLGSAGWQRLVDSDKLDLSEVRVLATTPAYSEFNWSVRPRMSNALRQKLTQALLKLDPRQPAHREVLTALGAPKLIAAQPEQFAALEQAARSAGMLDKKPGN